MQDPYNQATLHDDGSHYWGCHPSHLQAIPHIAAQLFTTPLRQSKQQASWTFIPSPLKASHRRGWGSWLKHRTGTTFTHRHTAERTCSTITIGVPTFIQFVVASVVPVAFCQCCCAYSALHSYLSNAAHIRCRFEQRTRILHLHSFPVTKISCGLKNRVLALPSNSPSSLTEYIFSDTSR